MTFQTTRWSLVLRARRGDSAGAAALAELCELYWPPVYALYRREGLDVEDARDLTQGLFADLLARGDLQRAASERGRFRAFLRSCARHWLGNERDRERAQKRGGGRELLHIDAASAETRLALEPVDRLDADALFERRWAQTVIESAIARLARAEAAAGRDRQFALLRPVLDGDGPPAPWADLARAAATTEGALKVAAHRLKAAFRDCLLAEVHQTLSDEETAGDELACLLRALQG